MASAGTTDRSSPSLGGRYRALIPTLVVLGALLAAVGAIASIGDSHGAIVGLAAVGERTVTAGGVAGLWMLSAWGLGTLCRSLWQGNEPGDDRNDRAALALELGVGVAFMLTVSHLLGVFGGLGLVLAWVTLAPGWIAAGWRLTQAWHAGGRRTPTASVGGSVRASGVSDGLGERWWLLLWVVPTAVLLVASSNPPGWLWASEFAGYDALSYHLQLVREWLEAGRIRPVEHNVYSFLPGYVEAAGAHAAAMVGAGGAHETWPAGLLADGGWRALIPQWVHAWMTLAAAIAMRDFVRSLGAGGAAWIAGAFVLATPWAVVTGSLAYNEMGVVLLGTSAMAAAMTPGIRPAARGLLAGLLVGAACGAKPTALFMIGGPVGIALLVTVPVRAWLVAVGAGCVAGLVMLLPWLVRNWLASGNPVFPMLAGVFGSGHWSGEQVERYAGAHFAREGVADRLRMLVAPIGDAARGFGHTQWGVFLPMVIGAGIACVVRTGAGATRRLGWILVGGLVFQVIAWLAVTHLQSRFLLPTLVTGAALVGVALARGQAGGRESGGSQVRSRVVRRVLVSLAVLGVGAQSVLLVVVFARSGEVPAAAGGRVFRPNEQLVMGTVNFTGEVARDAIAQARRRERAEMIAQLTWPAAVNILAEPGEVVYLVGEARAFYVRSPVVYHTTWDASPLGDAIDDAAGSGGGPRSLPASGDSMDPKAWTRGLRARGIDLVLIHEPELARLIGRDGWYDPRITRERLAAWIGSLGEPMWVQADGSAALFRIGDGP